MMTVVTRRIEFDAAHRVMGHESKCAHLHGHRYAAEISASAAKLDEVSRVVDFGVIKEKVGSWIDEWWDHNILLNRQDPLFQLWERTRGSSDIFTRQPYSMGPRNPTAEVIAEDLFRVASGMLNSAGLTITKVRIWETPNCYADFFG